MLYILSIVAAYLLGSISNAVWIGKAFFKIDVREHGSKNAGATNVLRVLGWKAGAPVFLLDIAKGVGAVCLIYFTPLEKIHTDDFISNTFVGFQIALGIAAIVGHIFPVFASFKGGKGVATIAGVILAILPAAMLVAFGVFALCLLVTRYVSLSSLMAALCLPFTVIVVFDCWMGLYEPLTLEIFSLLVPIVIFITHRRNIKRLRNGTEQKIVIRKNASITCPKDRDRGDKQPAG
jgi:glycerol-3-phosphate acyltransferase PlsY